MEGEGEGRGEMGGWIARARARATRKKDVIRDRRSLWLIRCSFVVKYGLKMVNNTDQRESLSASQLINKGRGGRFTERCFLVARNGRW